MQAFALRTVEKAHITTKFSVRFVWKILFLEGTFTGKTRAENKWINEPMCGYNLVLLYTIVHLEKLEEKFYVSQVLRNLENNLDVTTVEQGMLSCEI